MVIKEYVEIYQGEGRSIPLRVTTKDGLSFDLTGYTDIHVRFRKFDGLVVLKTLTTEGGMPGGVSVVDAAAGRVTVDLSPSDTASMKAGERQNFTVIIYKGNRAQVTSGGITIKSKEPGTKLNGLEIVFDGVQTVEQVINAYNESVQPELEVYFVGDGSTVLASSTLELSGGTDNKRIVNFNRAISVLKGSI